MKNLTPDENLHILAGNPRNRDSHLARQLLAARKAIRSCLVPLSNAGAIENYEGASIAAIVEASRCLPERCADE